MKHFQCNRQGSKIAGSEVSAKTELCGSELKNSHKSPQGLKVKVYRQKLKGQLQNSRPQAGVKLGRNTDNLTQTRVKLKCRQGSGELKQVQGGVVGGNWYQADEPCSVGERAGSETQGK